MSVETEIIRIFILAENRLLREALALLLGEKNNIRVVDGRAFSQQVVRQVAGASPDVLLSDTSAFASTDFQVIAEARAAVPGLKVMIMGIEEDRDTFLGAVREGILGYVLNGAPAIELAAAVRAMADGRAVCPPNLCFIGPASTFAPTESRAQGRVF
jgi:DNA-binding NarL/FixJ family response regulator